MKREMFFLIFLAMIILPTPAFAYVDPSVMTYTVQTIAAVIIGMSAIIGLLWRRAVRNAKKVLNIDENAGKEVEDDVIEIMPSDTTQR
ncbi:MAG: hypothetical protein Q4C96_11135 [Planctomycetia bacterium]|nr:hypothetical protein [Planctomycetia bacterium]